MRADTFEKLESCSTSVIAAIDGDCLGGGMELATCADLRVASDRSTFGQIEVSQGLLPGWGGTQRLQHIVGFGRAKEIVFAGERYDAETMEAYGFVNEVVEHTALGERTEELATKLADGPTAALGFAKKAMLYGREDVEAGLEIEAQSFAHVMTSGE
jgi:enoyl-CoA hydratase / 3-hydroxyacyl-CoA dehydrogenase